MFYGRKIKKNTVMCQMWTRMFEERKLKLQRTKLKSKLLKLKVERSESIIIENS